MSPENVPSVNVLDRLRIQLREFERYQLGRPAHVSLSEYLQHLAEEQIIPERTTDLVASLYTRIRYGEAVPHDDDIEQAMTGLELALQSLRQKGESELSQLVQRLRDRLTPQKDGKNGSNPTPTADIVTEPTVGLVHQDVVVERQNVSVEEPDRPFPKKRRQLLWTTTGMALLFIWTSAVVVAGYAKHDDIQTMLQAEWVPAPIRTFVNSRRRGRFSGGRGLSDRILIVRFLDHFDVIDSNGDSFIDKEELNRMMENFR